MNRLQRLSLLALLTAGPPVLAQGIASTYAVTDLGNIFPTGVNDSGWVSAYDGGALLWRPGVGITVLASCSGCSNRANAINNAGQVTGWAYDASRTSYRAVVWQGGMQADLGALPQAQGIQQSIADAINAYGIVAGQSAGQFVNHPQFGNQGFSHAARFDGVGYPVDLEDRPEGTMVSRSRGINDSGAVVGQRSTPSGWRAVYWSAADDAIDLGALWGVTGPGNESFALDINCSGQVALELPLSPGHRTAAIWQPTTGFTNIGRLPGHTVARTNALNDAGLAVGVSALGTAQGAFAWTEADGMVALSVRLHPTLAAGWTILDATGVSESGLIVGRGFSTTLGYRGVLLTPTQCANFIDVDADSPFCSSVSWMKGRNVTRGCSGSAYCPDADVTRLAMAAFMQRLGDALSPDAIVAAAAPGALDFASAPIVCETDPIAPAGAPRRAVLDAVFSGVAGADSVARARIVVSEDDGVSWQQVGVHPPQATFKAVAWRNLRANALHELLPNKTVRYGLRMDRGVPADPASVADSTCRLRVRVENGITPAPL